MKTGTMSHKEFQSGAGRARLRQKTPDQLKAQADAAKEKLADKLGHIANQRMLLLIPWWTRAYPTRRLRVIFGNGTAFISIDGRGYYPGHRGSRVQGSLTKRTKNHRSVSSDLFQTLDDALEDVDDITTGLNRACPSDFVIEPIKPGRR